MISDLLCNRSAWAALIIELLVAKRNRECRFCTKESPSRILKKFYLNSGYLESD